MRFSIGESYCLRGRDKVLVYFKWKSTFKKDASCIYNFGGFFKFKKLFIVATNSF